MDFVRSLLIWKYEARKKLFSLWVHFVYKNCAISYKSFCSVYSYQLFWVLFFIFCWPLKKGGESYKRETLKGLGSYHLQLEERPIVGQAK